MLHAILSSWWFWAALAALLAGLAMVAGAGALATLTATGAHHHQLNRRQRRMGRWAFVAGATGAPLLGSLAALSVAVWRLLA
jgi:hypothetical protein